MAFILLEDLVTARTLALRSVLKPDSGYFWRKLCRWSCDYLNISILEAEQMPLNKLLQHYYEWHFEEMDEDKRDQILEKIIRPADELVEEDRVETEALDEFEEMVRAEAEASAKRRGQKVRSKEEAKKPQAPPKEPDPPPFNLADLPDNVSVKFADTADLDERAGWDLFGPPQK